MNYDLTILVPVYNEEATLPALLKKLGDVKSLKNAQLIIVNDGSTDKSWEIINDWAKSGSLPFSFKKVNHKTNMGKGAAIQTALALAKGKYFVIQDADLEYNPAEIPRLLEVALTNNAPAVYGSRFLGTIKNMPKPNYYANRFYNLMVSAMYGVKITDMHTCYKMIRTSLFKDLNMESQGFGYAPEIISKLLRRNVPIIETPITYHGRTVEEGKKINIQDGLECLYKLLSNRVKPEKSLFKKHNGKNK